MRILVATASRHGSTHDLGEVVADALRQSGHSVEHLDLQHETAVPTFDAAVIGSAIYMGNWLREARDFIGRNHVYFLDNIGAVREQIP